MLHMIKESRDRRVQDDCHAVAATFALFAEVLADTLIGAAQSVRSPTVDRIHQEVG